MAYDRPLPPIDPWQVQLDPLPKYDQTSLPSYLESEVDSLRDRIGVVGKDVKSLLQKPTYLDLGIDELKSDVKDLKKMIGDDDDKSKKDIVNLIKIQQKSKKYTEEEWGEFFLPIMKTLEKNIKRRIYNVIQDKINCEEQLNKGDEEDVQVDFDLDKEMLILEDRILQMLGTNRGQLEEYKNNPYYKPPYYNHVTKVLPMSLSNLKREIQRRLSNLEYKEAPILLYYERAYNLDSSTSIHGYIQMYLITTKRVFSIVDKGAPGLQPGIDFDTGKLYNSELYGEIRNQLGLYNIQNYGGQYPDYYKISDYLSENKDMIRDLVYKYNKKLSELFGFKLTIEEVEEFSSPKIKSKKIDEIYRTNIGNVLYYSYSTAYGNINALLYMEGNGQGATLSSSVQGDIKYTSYTAYRFDTFLKKSEVKLFLNISDSTTGIHDNIIDRTYTNKTYTPNVSQSQFVANRLMMKGIFKSIPGTYYPPFKANWIEEITQEGVMYINRKTGEISSDPPYLHEPEKY